MASRFLRSLSLSRTRWFLFCLAIQFIPVSAIQTNDQKIAVSLKQIDCFSQSSSQPFFLSRIAIYFNAVMTALLALAQSCSFRRRQHNFMCWFLNNRKRIIISARRFAEQILCSHKIRLNLSTRANQDFIELEREKSHLSFNLLEKAWNIRFFCEFNQFRRIRDFWMHESGSSIITY